MKTAKPANREKVWTAGMEDSAPAGRRKRYDTSGLRVSGCCPAHLLFPPDPLYTDHFRIKTIFNRLSVFSGIKFKQKSRFTILFWG